jgi:hypothetical protein
MTICKQTFRMASWAEITVSAIKTDRDGRFAVKISWPAGMDSAPSVRWFESEMDAMTGYLAACGSIRSKYAAK